jgi:hypothetical protein
MAIIAVLSWPSHSRAAIHTYDIGERAFSGSWLHSATGTSATENGPRWNGYMVSDKITGTLSGDLNNNILSDVSGTVTGKLGALNLHAPLSSYSSADNFLLRLGGQVSNGTGALRFETDGADTGQYTGGYVDFALDIVGGAANVLTGTLFFKPQAETPSAVLTPNRGDSTEFTLWGLNWMHDGNPVGGGESIDWIDFLTESLDYTGTAEVDRPTATLGIALYAVDQDPEVGMHSPEPTAFVVWALLLAVGASLSRRETT